MCLLLLPLSCPIRGITGHNFISTDIFLIFPCENDIYWVVMWMSWGLGYWSTSLNWCSSSEHNFQIMVPEIWNEVVFQLVRKQFQLHFCIPCHPYMGKWLVYISICICLDRKEGGPYRMVLQYFWGSDSSMAESYGVLGCDVGLMVPDVLWNVWDLSFNETASHSIRSKFSVLQWSVPCLHPWGVMHIYTCYWPIPRFVSWGS
jgi:hypothetical protein